MTNVSYSSQWSNTLIQWSGKLALTDSNDMYTPLDAKSTVMFLASVQCRSTFVKLNEAQPSVFVHNPEQVSLHLYL